MSDHDELVAALRLLLSDRPVAVQAAVLNKAFGGALKVHITDNVVPATAAIIEMCTKLANKCDGQSPLGRLAQLEMVKDLRWLTLAARRLL